MSDNVSDHKPIVLEHRQVGEAVGDFPPDRRLQLPLTAEERTVLRGRRCSDCGRSLLLQFALHDRRVDDHSSNSIILYIAVWGMIWLISFFLD